MQKIFYTLLFMGLSILSFAQDKMDNNEKLTIALFNEICKEIEIDDDTKDKLRPIYIDFVTETRPRKHLKSHQDMPPLAKTEEEIEKEIKEQFAHAIKLTKLREEYYLKFRTLLKPSQIKEMYDVERQVMFRIHSELGERDEKRGFAPGRGMRPMGERRR